MEEGEPDGSGGYLDHARKNGSWVAGRAHVVAAQYEFELSLPLAPRA